MDRNKNLIEAAQEALDTIIDKCPTLDEAETIVRFCWEMTSRDSEFDDFVDALWEEISVRWFGTKEIEHDPLLDLQEDIDQLPVVQWTKESMLESIKAAIDEANDWFDRNGDANKREFIKAQRWLERLTRLHNCVANSNECNNMMRKIYIATDDEEFIVELFVDSLAYINIKNYLIDVLYYNSPTITDVD